jgi:hypothetical protein
MKKFQGHLKLIVIISFSLLLLDTQNGKAQDCLAKLKQFNTVQTGIPSAKIKEYEHCVATLTPQSNKDLLVQCYNKLIRFYDDENNNTKVNDYKSKLGNLTARGNGAAKPRNDSTPAINPKKDTSRKKGQH